MYLSPSCTCSVPGSAFAVVNCDHESAAPVRMGLASGARRAHQLVGTSHELQAIDMIEFAGNTPTKQPASPTRTHSPVIVSRSSELLFLNIWHWPAVSCRQKKGVSESRLNESRLDKQHLPFAGRTEGMYQVSMSSGSDHIKSQKGPSCGISHTLSIVRICASDIRTHA